MRTKRVAYTPQDRITNSRIYNQFLQMGVDDGWDRRDKRENFELLTKIFIYTQTLISGSTILDVGCGTGDFVAYLADQNIKEYMGIDIFEPAIEKAREKFPQYTFKIGDFLRLNLKSYDFVFCSGAMTTKLDSDNYDIVQSWIPKMWKLAKKGVAFNFLVEDNSEPTSLFLYEPDIILTICKNLTPKPHIKKLTTSAGWKNALEEMHVFLYK